MAALPENDRIAGPFLASAGQTDFPADFPLIRADAVRVRRVRADVGVEVGPDNVTPVDVVENGFIARLTEPCIAGDTVWVFSRLPAVRDRQHTLNGAVRTKTLEDDAVYAQAQLQEQRRDLERALVVRPGEIVPSIGDIANASAAATEAVAARDEAVGIVGNTLRRVDEIVPNMAGEILLKDEPYALDGDLVLDEVSALRAGRAFFVGGDPLGAPILLDTRRDAWTPALLAQGSPDGLAYSSRDGRLHASPEFGFLQLSLTLMAKGSARGALVIAGLPEGALTSARHAVPCVITAAVGAPGDLRAVMHGGVIELMRSDAPLMAHEVTAFFSVTLTAIFPRF